MSGSVNNLPSHRFYFKSSSQIVNVLLVVTVAGTIFSSIQLVINNPTDTILILATSLPTVSTFFINYLLLQGLIGSAIELTQAYRLLWNIVIVRWFAKTPRQLFIENHPRAPSPNNASSSPSPWSSQQSPRLCSSLRLRTLASFTLCTGTNFSTCTRQGCKPPGCSSTAHSGIALRGYPTTHYGRPLPPPPSLGPRRYLHRSVLLDHLRHVLRQPQLQPTHPQRTNYAHRPRGSGQYFYRQRPQSGGLRIGGGRRRRPEDNHSAGRRTVQGTNRLRRPTRHGCRSVHALALPVMGPSQAGAAAAPPLKPLVASSAAPAAGNP
ncbi:hypothetical protein BC937DRAFT_92715, partial [Endogone sp. FLAS-F59071]